MSLTILTYGDVSKFVREGNQRAILALVTNVTAQAKALAPVDKGQLRNSIMGRTKETDIGFNNRRGEPAPREITPVAKEGQGYVGSNLLHAIYNEFGTRYLAAQPFLRPAINAQASGADVFIEVKKYQNEAVRKGLKKGPRKKRVVK